MTYGFSVSLPSLAQPFCAEISVNNGKCGICKQAFPNRIMTALADGKPIKVVDLMEDDSYLISASGAGKPATSELPFKLLWLLAHEPAYRPHPV